MSFFDDIAGVFDDIVSPFVGFNDDIGESLGVTKALDPGKDERARAAARDEEAMGYWKQMLSQKPVIGEDGKPVIGPDGKPVTQGTIYAWDDPMFSLDAPDLQQYSAGDPMRAAETGWRDAGSSAYSSMRVDPSAMADMRGASDYYQKLAQGGADAQAQAALAKATAQSEQARRAQAQASLAQAEAQGRANSGAALLGELTANSGMVSDQYQAGLDAQAQAQGRRDAAAQAWGQMGQNVANTQMQADQAKAQGMDSWNSWQADSRAAAKNRDADRRQAANQSNFDRRNTVSDANTQAENEKRWWEGPGQAQAMYDRQAGVVGGMTNQLSNNANNLREDGKNQYKPANVFGNLFSSFAGGGGG